MKKNSELTKQHWAACMWTTLLSLESLDPDKGSAALASSLGTNCSSLFLSFFCLMESGSERFSQKTIYVSIFQRHFMCNRERWKRKSQNLNKSNLVFLRGSFPPEIKKCLLFFIFLLLPALQCESGALSNIIFSNDPNPGDPAGVWL